MEDDKTSSVDPKESSSDSHTCRFYENEFPSKDDFVMVRIERLEEFCAFVSLVEYAHLEATIQFSELSSTRMRKNPSSIIKPGKYEVLQVLRVDEDKGYVDLSRKNIKSEEIEQCQIRYNKGKTVHSLMNHVVSTLNNPGITLEFLFSKIVWPLAKVEAYEHPLDAFHQAVTDQTLMDQICANVPEEPKKCLQKDIIHRLSTQQVKILAAFECTCFTSEGVDAIVPTLQAGYDVLAGMEAVENPKIAVISAPLYSITVSTKNYEKGMQVIDSALNTIKQEIEKRRGSFVFKSTSVAEVLAH